MSLWTFLRLPWIIFETLFWSISGIILKASRGAPPPPLTGASAGRRQRGLEVTLLIQSLPLSPPFPESVEWGWRLSPCTTFCLSTTQWASSLPTFCRLKEWGFFVIVDRYHFCWLRLLFYGSLFPLGIMFRQPFQTSFLHFIRRKWATFMVTENKFWWNFRRRNAKRKV